MRHDYACFFQVAALHGIIARVLRLQNRRAGRGIACWLAGNTLPARPDDTKNRTARDARGLTGRPRQACLPQISLGAGGWTQSRLPLAALIQLGATRRIRPILRQSAGRHATYWSRGPEVRTGAPTCRVNSGGRGRAWWTCIGGFAGSGSPELASGVPSQYNHII